MLSVGKQKAKEAGWVSLAMDGMGPGWRGIRAVLHSEFWQRVHVIALVAFDREHEYVC